MTDFLGSVGTHPSEYGYGVGYGLCYGAWSSPYSSRGVDFPPTADKYGNFYAYPNPLTASVQLSGDGDIELSKKETDPVGAVSDHMGTLAEAYTVASWAPWDDSPNLDFSSTLGWSVQRYFLYDTVHVIPDFVNLGVVSAEMTVTISVWNAFLTDATASSIFAYNAEGFSDNLSVLTPFDIPALAGIDWVFTVSPDIGDSSIQAAYRITVEGVPYEVEFIGTRAAAWAFTHNWTEPLVETLSWLTSLRTTFDGKEARASIRDVARRGLNLNLYLDGTDAKRMENVLFKWQAKNLMVPFPQYRSQLSLAALAGDSTLFLDTAMKGFATGGNLLIINENTKDTEIATVASVPGTNDRVILQGPISADWSKGASVYPAAGALLQGNVPLVWQTQNFVQGQVAFEFDPTFTEPLTPYAAATDLYRGEEVLTQEPDWNGGLSKDFTYAGGVVDNAAGVKVLYPTSERPSRSTTFRWMLSGETAIFNFRKFLYRRRGMAVSFWMPSWVNDFKSITKTYTAGDAALRFYDNNFFLNSADRVERGHLQLHLKNGTVLRRKIVSSSSVSANISEIALDSAFGVEFDSEEIVRASFLSRYRLGSDSITLEWQHPRLVNVSLQLVTVPDYPSQDEV